MTGSTRRRAWRRHAPALALLLAIAFASVAAVAAGSAVTGVNDFEVKATTPLDTLSDGSRVNVNVSAGSALNIVRVVIRQCRLGATYVTEDDMQPAAGNCPGVALSSSSDLVIVRTSKTIDGAHTPGGINVSFRVGTGTAKWVPAPGAPESSLTCDTEQDCALVVQLQTNQGFKYSVQTMHFVVDDPIAGCGGPAKGVLTTGGSDRLSNQWSAWTRAACELPGASGAASRYASGGEDVAVGGFGESEAEGQLDVAYTAAGYNDEVGLIEEGTTERQAVMTPIALNAAVIAVGGGTIASNGDKVPYPELQLTTAELASLFGGGASWITRDDKVWQADILARNPSLNGHLFAIIPPVRPLAASDGQAASYYMSKYFTDRNPDEWIVPFTDPLQHRDASVAFAKANPDFGILELFTGKPTLQKFTEQALSSPSTDGGIWAITDLATARTLGMTPVAIEAPNGSFVAPNAETMSAAVETMKPDANGVLQPDPQAQADVAAPAGTPYPLTFVEYAMAPAQPLFTEASCTKRTDSQALLNGWLNYITGEDGQAALTNGLVPLTPALATAAADAKAKVGASPVTGPCASVLNAPPAGGGSTPTGAAAGPNAAGALPNTGVRAPGFNAAAGPLAAATGTGDGTETLDVAAVPAFAGYAAPNTLDGALALLGIVVITTLAAWVTSGQHVGNAALAGVGGAAARTAAVAKAPVEYVRRSPGLVVALWAGVAIASVGLVVYQLGPMLSQRDQRDLLVEYRKEVRQAANERQGLPGVEVDEKAPEVGAPVGILEVGALKLQSVVVEGVAPEQTQEAPGHVPGTSGLGQQGNSVVVARRNGYGGEFGNLSSVKRGARILVTTTQGQTVYKVTSNRTMTITEPDADSSSSTGAGTGSTGTGVASDPAATATSAPADGAAAKAQAEKMTSSAPSSTTLDELYAAGKDDRLTLVTSASRSPWNSSEAQVVVAKVQGLPYEYTTQNGRTDESSGKSGDSGAWPAIALALLAYGGAIAASVLLYRRMQFRVAYLLTIAPLVALTVIAGIMLSRLLPAWT